MSWQVERVVLFFLTKQGEFARTLATLRRSQDLLLPTDLDAMHVLSDGCAARDDCSSGCSVMRF